MYVSARTGLGLFDGKRGATVIRIIKSIVVRIDFYFPCHLSSNESNYNYLKTIV